MGRKALLETQVTGDDGPFTRTLERAEKRAGTFAAKVEKNFIGIFKRDPSQRAENAVSNLIGDITSGNTARGLAQFAGRISGLGIIAGIGIGAVIDIFDKVSDSIKTVEKDSEALRQQMLKPVNLIAGLSPDQISQQVGQINALFKKLEEDQKSFSYRFGRGASEVFSSLFNPQASVSDPGWGKKAVADARQLQDAYDRIALFQRNRADAELELANARKMTGGDETQSALSELYFKSRQAESAISLEGGKGAADRIKALKIEEERLTDQIVHRSEVREQEFKTAEKLLKLERSSMPEDKKKVLAAAIGLDVVNKSLGSPDITTGERRALTLDKLRKENELRSLTKNTRNPFAFGTTAARDWEDQNAPGFGSIAKRNAEMNDPSVYGSLAQNAVNRGDRPMAQNVDTQQMLLNELQKLTALTEKVWNTQ